MNPFPQVESRPQSALLISTIAVVNIIWWMVMIAAIGLGATHLGRCPVQPFIPIFLIVLGGTSILSMCVTYTKSSWGDGIVFIVSSACMTILHLFTFCWFIAGTLWVYPVYPPNYTPGAAQYCQKTTYQFAFCVTTLLWVAITLMFVCGCCCALVTCCTTVTARRRLIPNRHTFYGAVSEDLTAGDV